MLPSTAGLKQTGGRELKRIVFDEETIARRVRELGQEITAAYRDGELLVLGLLKGSFIVLSDLVRRIERPLQVDVLVAASYGADTISSGNVRLLYDPETELRGKHILLVEDIVDTGKTLNRMVSLLRERGPRSLEICALLHKHLAPHLELEPAFVGFDAPRVFLVGYGLDHAENFTMLLPFESTDAWVTTLRQKGVDVRAREEKQSFGVFLFSFLPYLFIIGLLIFMVRQMQQGGNRAFAFGKSKAKLLAGDTPKVTFADVAGADEAKQELEEIIDFLKDPQKFQRLGGRLPKGALLVGPPGTGKTLLAKAVAGEAGRPFFSMSGSDFVEMFVGVGASRVRDLFEQGKAHAPCIIFIDEIDGVGRHRGAGLGGGHDEREQTLYQLLVEMDGFESNEGVILVAATNRPDVLDPALLRPGRFDRRVVVGRPDVQGREAILRVHTRKIPLSEDVDISVIARGTPGFTGADLANLVNEAALNAARYNKKFVAMGDFELAKDKVLMGAERKSMVISNEEKRVTAYHEAGHTLVGLKVPNADPVHKVTIIPRGRALGITAYLPEEELHKYTKQSILSRLAMAYGGRVAEELVFGPEKVTTGAAQDIQHATDI